MRTLFVVATTGLLLTIDLQGADSQTVVWRPAIDGIGNAYAPAGETPGIPDGADFSAGYDRGVTAGRGKVTVETSSMSSARSRAVHRKTLTISR
jgi:hypothetical protein